MSEPDEILVALAAMIDGRLEGWRIVVTAGGTREPIDPVRFIGNRSTGKMGYAIARQAARRGADVVLVSSSPLEVPPGVSLAPVETADEMAAVVAREAPDADVVIMAAAVADFRPATPASAKLRRTDGPPTLELESTIDILGRLGEMDKRPFLVGFAAETGPVDRAKWKASRADLTVANDVTAEGSGFGTDTNRVTILDADGNSEAWPLLPKDDVASRLLDEIEQRAGPNR